MPFCLAPPIPKVRISLALLSLLSWSTNMLVSLEFMLIAIEHLASKAIKDEFEDDEEGFEKEIEDRKQFCEIKLRNFLNKTNEKWMLDQFNLVKRFVLQNSIEGKMKDFSHPVFEHLNEENDNKNFTIQRPSEDTKEKELYD